jgi:RNA-binding protein YhbY
MESTELKKVILIDEEVINQINQKLDEIIKISFVNKADELGNKWLNNEQVKELLGVSTRTLQNYRDQLVIPFSQHGKKIYYSKADIEKYMNDHRIKF